MQRNIKGGEELTSGTPSVDMAKSETSSFYTFDNDSKAPKVFTSNLPSPIGSDQ